jgi:hypothetical protein
VTLCAVGVCSAPDHCREIGRCGAQPTDRHLFELCTILGIGNGTWDGVMRAVRTLKAEARREPSDARLIPMREGPARDPRCAWPFPTGNAGARAIGAAGGLTDCDMDEDESR